LLPSLTKHQCGRPTAVRRTRSSTPATPSPNPESGRYAPDRVPVAAARAAHHPHRTAATVTIVMRPKPASTCHGPLAQCPKTPGAGADGRSRATARRLSPMSSQPDPITVPAALTTSRCRTQAESADRLSGDAWPNPGGSRVTPGYGRQTEHPARHVIARCKGFFIHRVGIISGCFG
jgi:hypothetical protein